MLARGARQLDGDAQLAYLTLSAGLVQLDDHLARAHELGGQRLVELEQGLQAAVVLGGERLPVGPGTSLEDLGHLCVRLRAGMLELLGDELLAADAAAPRLPELRLQRPQRHPSVGALIRPVADERARQRQITAAGNDPVGEVAGRDHRQPRERAVGHRHVDDLSLTRSR